MITKIDFKEYGIHLCLNCCSKPFQKNIKPTGTCPSNQCVEMSFTKDFSQLSTDYNGVKIKKGTFMKGFFFFLGTYQIKKQQWT